MKSLTISNLSPLRFLLRSRIFTGVSLCLIIFFCYTLSTAEAHRPAFPDGSNISSDTAFQLDGIDISQAVYQVLGNNNQVWLQFDPASSESRTIPVQLGIPVLEETASFRPMVAIIAPNLRSIDLPFPVPSEYGAILYKTNDEQPIRTFHERFTNTHSWILIEEEFDITETGIHYIVVFSDSRQSGKFWFATGTKEVFDFSSIANLNKNISRVKSFHTPDIVSDNNVQDDISNWNNPRQQGRYLSSVPTYLTVILLMLVFVVILVLIRKK